jgi:hypothetical protein
MNGVTPVPFRPLVYHVASRKAGVAPHLVDLTDFNGNGSCTCGDWSCRCVANMKGAHELFTDATMCHHIRTAHMHFIGCVLDEILEK